MRFLKLLSHAFGTLALLFLSNRQPAQNPRPPRLRF